MKNEKINLGLTGYDELFMSSEEREDMKKPKVEEISILDLRPFKDHPLPGQGGRGNGAAEEEHPRVRRAGAGACAACGGRL